MVGSDGLILKGNATHGFARQGFSGDTQSLLSTTRFRDRHVIASDYALHLFDDHLLKPLKPRLHRKIQPTPFKVQTVDNVMFYFDYRHGVYRWDGETWEEIVIPPELLDREFKGLRPRR